MDFKFPDLGEGLTEGEIVKWLVKVGDVVRKDQVVLEVETDKAVAEIPSPIAGRIAGIRHREGEVVRVGEILFVIEPEGKAATAASSGTKPAAKAEKPVQQEPSVVGKIEGSAEVLNIRRAVPAARAGGEVLATPAVRLLAKQLGVDISVVKGGGKDGRIEEADLRGAAKSSASSAPVQYDGPVERIPLRGTRKKTAEHMAQAVHLAAAVTHCDRADVTKLVALRRRQSVDAEKKALKLTFLPYIIKAAIAALAKHPIINSSLEGEEIILKRFYNIGFAVDTESGLRVPVLKNANRKSLLDIAKEIAQLADKARDRSIDVAEMKGSTFTITNYGSIGGTFATPILNYPEAGILGIGKIREEPVVVNGKIEIRSIAYLSFTFDHRIFDGVEAARFVNDVIALLESPEKL